MPTPSTAHAARPAAAALLVALAASTALATPPVGAGGAGPAIAPSAARGTVSAVAPPAQDFAPPTGDLAPLTRDLAPLATASRLAEVAEERSDRAAPDSLPRARYASLFLPPGHWAVEALRRLFSLGLTPRDHDPSMLALPRGEAAEYLAYARREAGDRDPEIREMVTGYLERFREEFPAAVERLERDGRGENRESRGAGERPAEKDGRGNDAGRSRTGRSGTGAGPAESGRPAGSGATLALEGALGAGGELREGAVLAEGWDPAGDSARGPVPAPDVRAGTVTGRLGAYLGSALAAEARGTVRLGEDGGREALEAAYLTAALGDLGVWAGRRVPGYGPGRGGQVVLGRRTAFDGAGIYLTEGVRLPWILQHIGTLRFETFAARLDRNGPIVHPWLWLLRGSLSPHPRLRIGGTAATHFGGENNPVPTTLGNILKMMTAQLVSEGGDEGGQFTDGYAAFEAWYRPPLGTLPVSLYVEWGFGDTAGGWLQTPAITGGLRLDALPGARSVSLGLEGAYFAPPCCGHGHTYAGGPFQDGWAREGRLYGHPLGGTGKEARTYATVHDLDARLRLRADAFVRDRGATNRLAPALEGTAAGGELRLRHRIGPSELDLRAALESSLEAAGGEGWTRARLELRYVTYF